MKSHKSRAVVVWATCLTLLALFAVVLATRSSALASYARASNAEKGPSGGTFTPTPSPTVTVTGTPPCVPMWAEKTPYPYGVMGEAMVSYNGSLYGFGGRDFTYTNRAEAWRYDPAADHWTQLASMPAVRNWAGAAEAGGYIYVVNGTNGGAGLNTVFRYDIAANTWTILPNTIGATYGPAVVSLNNKLYRIGGLDDQGVYTSTVEIVGQGDVAPLPQGLAWASAVAFNGYIYTLGGIHDGPYESVTYRYDPATDSWDDVAITDLPDGKALSAAGVLNGHIIVAGGGNDYSTAYSWDPATNVWSTIAPLLYPRFNVAGGVVGNSMYVVGGVNDNGPSAINQAYSDGQCVSPTVTVTPTASPTQPAPTATACVIGTVPDLPAGSAFYSYARCLLCRGIMSLYPCGAQGEPCTPGVAGYFRPGAQSTRGQLAKVVSLAAGFNEAVSGQTFTDVPPASTFYVYIERMSQRQLLNGYPCGGTGEPCDQENRPYFRPGSNTTRGQLTKLVSNAAGFIDPPAGQTFEDVQPGSTFYTFTERLVSRSIMSGYPCGGLGEPCVAPSDRPYFRPSANVTRGQTAKIVSNTFLPDCSTP